MRIGVRAHDFGRHTAPDLASTIKNAGFETVQLAPAKAIEGVNSFDEITPLVVKNIGDAFTNAALDIDVIGCYIEPSIQDDAARLNNVETFKNSLSIAKELGVPIVGTETTGMALDTPAEVRKEAYARLLDSVLRMTEHAEKVGVNVGIEPVVLHTLCSSKLTCKLLDDVKSPRLKIIFDPVNMMLPETMDKQHDIFSSMFDLVGNDIVAMHIKDVSVENNKLAWRIIGEGDIDYRGIMAWLKIHKPDIALLREGVAMDSYEKCLNNMKEMIQ